MTIIEYCSWCMGHEKTHKACNKKYKPYILKYKALILKYVPCIFYYMPYVFKHIPACPSRMPFFCIFMPTYFYSKPLNLWISAFGVIMSAICFILFLMSQTNFALWQPVFYFLSKNNYKHKKQEIWRDLISWFTWWHHWTGE